MNFSIFSQSRLLQAGFFSLALGAGALAMPAANAFALSATVSDTLNSFTVVEQIGGGFNVPNDGINERYVGGFDFTGDPDYANFIDPLYSLSSAMLTVNVSREDFGGINDGFYLGGVKDLSDEVIGLPEIFLYNGFGPGFSPIPGVGVATTYTVNLLDYYSTGDLWSVILGGDNAGGVWLRFGDDHFLNSASLELTAIQNPEPASILLLGTGMIGLAAWRLRKKGQA